MIYSLQQFSASEHFSLQLSPGLQIPIGQFSQSDIFVVVFATTIALVAINNVAPIKIIFFIV
jgi:hypothetical protein